MISPSDNMIFYQIRRFFVLSFNFNVTQNYPAAIQALGQRMDLYSLNLDNASFWRGLAIFELIFLSNFFTKLEVFVLIRKKIT